MDQRYPVLALLLISSSLHAGGVFWTDRGAGELKRMNFDGSDLQTISLSGEVTSSGSNTRGIALDLVSERIFWADNGADQILRANFDGSSSTILTTIDGSSFPADVHLDPVNNHLYWCDQARGQIERSDFGGLSISVAVADAALTGPYFMDLDLVSNKIYWGDFGGGAIYRSNPDGSQRETLLTGNSNTRGVRVDPFDQRLYWINRDAKKVHRAPLSAFAGGAILITDPAVETLYDNLDTPHGLAIDIPARKVYWADTGTNSGQGQGGSAVSRGDLDGSTPMEIIAAGSQPWDVELDRRCRNYGEWRSRCFRQDASSLQTSPEANPDGDLANNALEYMFDSAPLFPDNRVVPEPLLVSGPIPGATYPAIRFRRRIKTTDLTSYVQVSTNLTDWSGTPGSPVTMEHEVTLLGDDMEEVIARALNPVAAASMHFMRLVVELDF